MGEEHCATCGGPLREGEGGRFCGRCLFGTAMAELASSSEERSLGLPEVEAALPDYEIGGVIGEGGMGKVFDAREHRSGERVAIKVLNPACAMNPELVERFRREAEVLESLEHPHIVRVLHWGERGGLLFLVMEFLPQGDLAKRLLERGPVELAEALRLADQVAAGLEYSHGKGVLHRDLKPGNLLLDADDRIKISDFGLAKVLGLESDLGLTLTHAAMGTPRYMAPEQMDAAGSADERSDIYSLGVVFYEMLTGQLPGGNFALPSEKVKVGEDVDEWVLCAMSDDPQQRFGDIREARASLQSLGRSRGSWKWIAGGVAAVACLLAAVMLPNGMEGPPGTQGAKWVFESQGGSLPVGFPESIERAVDVVVSDSRRPFGVALLDDGSLVGFGDDSYGQASPPAGSSFVKAAVGLGERAAHGLALTEDGEVVAWGDDSYGQASVPEALGGAVEIQAGELWSAAKTSAGEVVVWGRDDGVDPETIAWSRRKPPGFGFKRER